MEINRVAERVHQKPEPKQGVEYPYSASAKVFHTNQLFLYSERVQPGERASAPHFHRAIDEIIAVVNGELYAIEGDEEVRLIEGDSVCFQAGSRNKHFLENRSQVEATFLIFRRSTTQDDVVY